MTIRENVLANLRARFDPSARLYTGTASSLPIQWRSYIGDDSAERRFALREEINAVEPYLPSTMAGLEEIALDALVVETNAHGILRIITTQMGNGSYDIYSALPIGAASERRQIWDLLSANGPQALTWIYESRMNGLTDLYGFTGFKASNLLTTMAEEVNTYGEGEWYEEFSEEHDVGLIVEILATGGGGYLLLDLSHNQSSSEDPDGLVVYMNEGTPPETVSFFQYLDMFMEIGLTEG